MCLALNNNLSEKLLPPAIKTVGKICLVQAITSEIKSQTHPEAAKPDIAIICNAFETLGGEIICHSHIQSIAIAYGKTKSHRGAEIEILVASQTTVADSQSIGIEAERCAYFYIKKWLDGKSAIINVSSMKITKRL